MNQIDKTPDAHCRLAREARCVDTRTIDDRLRDALAYQLSRSIAKPPAKKADQSINRRRNRDL